MFDIHPSKKLQCLFHEKPYQGQDPEKASVIILGLDANYGKKLEEDSDAFNLVEEYHQDGVKFWRDQKHKDVEGKPVHHPFLDKKYPENLRNGWKYHSNFARMGLSPKYSECISFVELLNMPTAGSAKPEEQKEKEGIWWQLFKEKSNQEHVKWLDPIITENTFPKKLILLCNEVILKMTKITREGGKFCWVPNPNPAIPKCKFKIADLKLGLHNDVFKTYHFSWPRTDEEIEKIRDLIKSYC